MYAAGVCCQLPLEVQLDSRVRVFAMRCVSVCLDVLVMTFVVQSRNASHFACLSSFELIACHALCHSTSCLTLVIGWFGLDPSEVIFVSLVRGSHHDVLPPLVRPRPLWEYMLKM